MRRIGHKLLRMAGDELPPPLESFPDCPDLFHQYRALAANKELTRKPGGWDYKGRFYPDMLTVGGGASSIRRVALRHCTGSGIDIGAGLWPLPGALPVDIWRGPGAVRCLTDIPENSMDYVFSSHCLEHVEQWREELQRWIGKLKPAGILFLYLPHPECGIWNPGSPMVGDGHKWQPEPEIVKQALRDLRCEILVADDGPDALMSFFVCARKET